jgi:acetyl esterase/lipase
MSHARVFALLLLLPVITGCSAFDLLNTASPSRHYALLANQAYGTLPRQQLDVYRPERMEPSGAAPLVVFFYGGGWKDGDKADYEFVASSLTRAGFVVMIPDYRLYPEVRFPEFVADGAAALAWGMDNAARFGADPGQVFVMGHSAGAHIAALLALDPRYLAGEGARSGALAGLIGLSGPYDFLPIEGGYLADLFPESRRAESQPIAYAGGGGPPTLLIHGTEDDTVWPRNSERLAAALRAADVPVTLELYEDVGHARVVATLAPPLRFLAATLDDCTAFIRRIAAESSR